MMPQAFRTAILAKYGQDALDAVVVGPDQSGHCPLGWGIQAADTDPASGSYGLWVTVDPRFVVWCGDNMVWQTARWFAPRGQAWSRAVLGDFGS